MSSSLLGISSLERAAFGSHVRVCTPAAPRHLQEVIHGIFESNREAVKVFLESQSEFVLGDEVISSIAMLLGESEPLYWDYRLNTLPYGTPGPSEVLFLSANRLVCASPHVGFDVADRSWRVRALPLRLLESVETLSSARTLCGLSLHFNTSSDRPERFFLGQSLTVPVKVVDLLFV